MLESGERAPFRALSVVRPKEPLEGKHMKKPATRLEAPMATASWLASRSVWPNLDANLRESDQELCWFCVSVKEGPCGNTMSTAIRGQFPFHKAKMLTHSPLSSSTHSTTTARVLCVP